MTRYEHPAGDVDVNGGRPVTPLRVANRGDRPVQVGSHYHVAEANRALLFERRIRVPPGSICTVMSDGALTLSVFGA